MGETPTEYSGITLPPPASEIEHPNSEFAEAHARAQRCSFGAPSMTLLMFAEASRQITIPLGQFMSEWEKKQKYRPDAEETSRVQSAVFELLQLRAQAAKIY